MNAVASCANTHARVTLKVKSCRRNETKPYKSACRFALSSLIMGIAQRTAPNLSAPDDSRPIGNHANVAFAHDLHHLQRPGGSPIHAGRHTLGRSRHDLWRHRRVHAEFLADQWRHLPVRKAMVDRVDHLWAPSPASHQCGDLRLRRQHDVRGHLPLHATSGEGAARIRLAVVHSFLGLAGDHRGSCHHLATRTLQRKGIRRTDLAPECGRNRHLGHFRDQLFLDPRPAQRTHPLRRDLVLHCHDHHRRPAVCGQPLIASHQSATQLPGVWRSSGCPCAVVVWTQRGGLLPYHPDSGDHVLLRAQGG
ncbi:MAG: hypothetical protein BWY82_01286 [Verrucomicrobia bacterium ADurb.Bin474]|nr:MAG: hypothetical protein BWY82_01286 [Verrucomicrobia bacterium ADurb.Bin474]